MRRNANWFKELILLWSLRIALERWKLSHSGNDLCVNFFN
jgi:hypothetical protein